MWAINNTTPYAAERGWVRDKEGGEVWLVVVKATFDILADGSLLLSREQEPVHSLPLYAGEPGVSEMLAESELIPPKPNTDILLQGHAYAPKGEPTRMVDTLMCVGKIEKRIRVFGDRFWEKGLVGLGISPALPFEKMPISYTRAFGGIDPISQETWEKRNPLGRGFCSKASHLLDQLLPNQEDPGKLIKSPKTRPTPMSFGPIAGDWMPRQSFTGTYDQDWRDERYPLPPLDFDDHFYQCAPADQQARGFLKGGERVYLENLSSGGRLAFRLPKITLGFETFFKGESETHRADMHTVILKPDQPSLSLVFHAHLPCHFKVNRLQSTRITEKRTVALGQNPKGVLG